MAYSGTPSGLGLYESAAWTGTLPNTIKPKYEQAAQMQFARDCIAYGIAMKNKKVHKGSFYYFAPKGMPGGAYAAIAETGEFAPPAPRDVALGRVSIRGFHGATLALTQTHIERSSDPNASFVDGLKEETKDAEFRLQKNINRQFYGDGSGNLCTYASLNTLTYTIDTTYAPGTTRYLAKGDELYAADINNSYALLKTGAAAAAVVTSVDSDTTFTVDAAISGIQAGDYFVLSRTSLTTGDDSREMQGMGSICSTSSTYKNINPTSAGYAYWKANTLALSAGTDFDLSYIWRVAAACQLNGESDPNIVLVAHEQMYDVYEFMSGSIRYAPGDAGKVGFSKAEVSLPSVKSGSEFTLKFKPDRYCPKGNVYMFPEEEIEMLELFGMKFLDKGDLPLLRYFRTQIMEGQLVWAGEPFTRRRNAFGMITGFSSQSIAGTFTG